MTDVLRPYQTDGVVQIDVVVRHDDACRRDENASEDDRQVLLLDRVDRGVAEAR